MVVSYLLNVERIRIAPSFTHGTVLRIEPPLIADARLCDHLIGALKRLLDVLQRGDSGELLGHLMGRSGCRTPPQSSARERRLRSRSATATQRSTRFAFVAHLLSVDDFRRFDPTLKPFGDAELEALRSRITEFMKPCPLDELSVQSADGRQAVGELIALPYLPSELVALPQDEAVELVQKAVDLGVERGAEVIGLAGFTSIVTLRWTGGAGARRSEGDQRKQLYHLVSDACRGGRLRQARYFAGELHGRNRRRDRSDRACAEPAMRRTCGGADPDRQSSGRDQHRATAGSSPRTASGTWQLAPLRGTGSTPAPLRSGSSVGLRWRLRMRVRV